MTAKRYHQYALVSGDSQLVCWLLTDDRLKLGTEITLKEIPDVRWKIAHRYNIELSEPPLKRWNVGGLP